MARKYVVLIALVALVVTLMSCKREADKPIPQATSGQPDAPSLMMPAGEPEIVVPESLKGVYSAVKISIEDKIANKTEDVTIELNSSYVIPGSNIRIQVGDYLPDFKMNGLTITSSSEEPNNPAVRVLVFDGEQEIFRGWLYSKFPAIHPFQHEKYGLMLVEGVKKG